MMYVFGVRFLRGIGTHSKNCQFSKKTSKLTLVKKLGQTLGANNFFRTLTVFERYTHGMENSMGDPDIEPEDVFKLGFQSIKHECSMFVDEVREALLQDHKIFCHGETDIVFRFNSEECIKQWRLGYDKLYDNGNSECSLIVNNNGKGLFSGSIDTTVPKDGKAKVSGYCAMRSKKKRKSFYRSGSFDWYPFTHLELKVRGDGRTYGILLGIERYFDVNWLDLHLYYLFTRGGPYWETVRIPFSKFFLTSKGRIQDRQAPVNAFDINSVGIVCAGVPGPFQLEIDYIGVHKDINHKEEFAYEMYKIPEYYVSG